MATGQVQQQRFVEYWRRAAGRRLQQPAPPSSENTAEVPSSDGIQKLLAAENEAQKIVADARKAKTDRLRQAKAEAEKEIAAYRAEREGAYQKRLAETNTGATANNERLDKEAQLQIRQIHEDVKQKKGQVVDLLLNYTTTVRF